MATVYASDQFTGSTTTDIGGRTTDSGLGGSSKTWTKGTAGTRSIGINGSNQAVKGSGSSANILAFDSGQGDVAAYITISSLSGTNQSIGVCVRATSTLSG